MLINTRAASLSAAVWLRVASGSIFADNLCGPRHGVVGGGGGGEAEEEEEDLMDDAAAGSGPTCNPKLGSWYYVAQFWWNNVRSKKKWKLLVKFGCFRVCVYAVAKEPVLLFLSVYWTILHYLRRCWVCTFLHKLYFFSLVSKADLAFASMKKKKKRRLG